MESTVLAILAALALLTRLGHVLHTMGSVRARSVAAVAARAAVGTACVVLFVYLAGRGLSSLNETGSGFSNDAADGRGAGRAEGLGVYFASPGSYLAILPLLLLPASLVGGATAERARVRGQLVILMLITVVALPATVALGWFAFSFADRPDPTGSYGAAASFSAVVRVWPVIASLLVAAAAAIAAARCTGPRAGKYNRDGSANSIPSHSLPLLIAGDALLIFALPLMTAVLAGDVAERLLNALLAASAASLCAAGLAWWRSGFIDAALPWLAAIGGSIAGSVSGVESPMVAIALGAVVGVLVPMLSRKIDLRFRIDEPSGLAIPHLLGALAGLSGAAFAGAREADASFGQALMLTSIALSGGILVSILTLAGTWIVSSLLSRAGWLRVDVASETEGLDLAQHDVNAYPDFQQTLIKSYHLRQ